MLTLTTIATGSTGNSYALNYNGKILLLECGVSYSKIKQGIDFKTSSVVGCLISHSHKDHCKSLSEIIGSGIKTYASHENIQESGVIPNHFLRTVHPGEQFEIGEFQIKAIPVNHDVPNMSYLIRAGEETIYFVTDTNYIPYNIPGLKHLIIEANYSEKILNQNFQNNQIEAVRVKRLYNSHYSIEKLIDYVKKCPSLQTVI